MGNKVLLIRPQNIYGYNNYPPLNLISIGSVLEAEGYQVKIVNCGLEKNFKETIAKELDGVLFAGVSLLTSEVPNAYEILKYLRKNTKAPIIVGGPHCTLFPEQMADCQYVDYVVVGEGEKHILEIARIIKSGEKYKDKIFKKEILDIEKSTLPDYSIDSNIERFIGSYLTDKLSQFVKQPMRWLPYESSRGCPSLCTFCVNVVTGNTRYRKKSADKVLNEIGSITKKYRISHLKIIDDNFFVDIERVRAICEGMIARNLSITWDAECRCDYFNNKIINDKTLKLLKAAGLVQLTLGIESGSQHSLDLMKKGITPKQAEFSVKKCNEYGIVARSSFIMEVPGDKLDDIKQTIKLINRLRKYPFFTCGANTFRPYPKCELTQQLIEDGLLAEPQDFESWIDKDIIESYSSAEYIMPWQANGVYSESAAWYINMESTVRLGNYLMEKKSDKLKNNIFTLIARLRNRLLFYKFPFDKRMYQRFFTNFYNRRQRKEKSIYN